MIALEYDSFYDEDDGLQQFVHVYYGDDIIHTFDADNLDKFAESIVNLQTTIHNREIYVRKG